MTAYLIVSGVTLLAGLFLAIILYLLFVTASLKSTCEKLTGLLDSIKVEYDKDVTCIYRDLDDREAAVRKDFEDVDRDNKQAVVEIYRDMGDHVNNLMTEIIKSKSELNLRMDDIESYIDSRLDQLLNKVEKEYVQKASQSVSK